MIIEKNKLFFVINKATIWFPDEKYNYKKNFSVIFIRQHNLNIDKKLLIFNQQFKTSLININQDINLIFDNFSSTTRYDIRQAIKSNIKIEYFNNSHTHELNYFLNNVNSFYKNKKIINNLNKKYFNNNNNIFLVKASDNKFWHTYAMYIYDNNRFRLLILINNYSKITKKLLGYSSKLLIWRSIENSKKLGCNIFDLGGLDNLNNSKLKGINKFKLSFGGSNCYEYNTLVVNNNLLRFFYKIYYFFKNLI